ncbi:hypothetical protein JQ557_33010 [Bradyrhizobium sp. U87765 SZCCT0131]|uniref:hypothetical protein n=1 Tax=unclassified Bradyrhizobium TaxID=2631580 RepID=UPI001BA93C02|nr:MULTISPECIES: hypothetical protein [unclassified Bradyrhizobium]MBR1222862.1 hypothetical protein [Bradyrhizobium sp. U87765 SZCCT0131]MBR1262598.1 hypothetical protein [Bradyrhizobium sp. U87765 SZCCT0134]MBR1308930.1 hypothetical protein [Bradyrhizobium sp. U87765 SZCCT0110]MBR1318380.1 hypothetical protein [Bradyrhizobium sp. U87765 SZCCT0109]MBR1352084.1 hypothetical protein [Bradyrhizobium sp. U87765 SZCCT0048]
MYRDWKISTFNGALLASYFIPAWAIPALKIVISPVHGLFYERANVGPAMFVSDILQFGTVATVRFAWLLALAKLTVVAFFILFLAALVRAGRRAAADEPLAIALLLGSLVSVASMVLTSQVGDVTALRLHATESLLLLSIGIVMLVETDAPAGKAAAAAHSPAGDAAVSTR